MAFRSRGFGFLSLLTSFLAVATLAACGDDTSLPPPTGRDAGRDMVRADTSLDAQRPDSVTVDGGAAGTCQGTGEFQLVDMGEDLRVALAANDDSFLMTWSANGPMGQVLMGSVIGADGTPSEPQALSFPFSSAQDPAITATDDGWMVLFSNNREGNFEIYTRLVAADGTVDETLPLRVTDNTLLDNRTGIARSAAGIFAAWNQQDVTGGGLPMIVQTELDAAGAAVGELQVIGADDGGYGPIQMGPFAAATAISWAIEGGGLAMQRFLSDGARRGDVLRLSDETVPSVGYAPLDSIIGAGGISVYETLLSGTRSEVRWRSVLDDGELSVNERELFRGIRTRAPSVAVVEEGHVVAMISQDADGASLLLATLDAVGNVLASGDFRAVADFNRASTWAAGTGNGTVLVLLSERVSNKSTLTALRFECAEMPEQ